MSASQPQAVRVCCRVRPALPSESTRCCTEITSFNGMRMIQLNDPRNTRESITYQFDEVYTAASTQEDIYRREGLLAAERIMSGFPASILAYGTASSGKTHTLYGQRETPGVGPQCVAALLKMVQEAQLADKSRPMLQVSYCELYQNQVFDLLAGKNPVGGPGGDINTAPQTFAKVGISSTDELWDLILRLREERAEQRKEAPAHADRASRSHTLMTVYVTDLIGEEEASADGASPAGGARLTLVDLAGNDDSRKGGASQQSRAPEPASVQHTLMALGRALAALHLKSGPVPLHESKLTQLMGDAFVEGSLTTLITCIAPHPKYYHDTSSSLDFAAHAGGQYEGTAMARSCKQADPMPRSQRPGTSSCVEASKRGGGASRSSFAAMMAPPPMLHPNPALCGALPMHMGVMRAAPPPHWMEGLRHPEAYQQHSAEAAAVAGSTMSTPMAQMCQPLPPAAYSGAARKDKAGIPLGASAAVSKKRKTAEGAYGSGEASFGLKTKEPPAKTVKYAGHPGPAWVGSGTEAGGDEASSSLHMPLQVVDAPKAGYDRSAAKSHQELSLADTPCRREVCTPLRNNALDMPASLLKSSGHKAFASDMSSLWGPMTPIASNVEFSHMSSSVKDSGLRLDLLGCTPRSGGDMLIDFDGASGDVGGSSSHQANCGGLASARSSRSSVRRRASTDLVALDESAAMNTSDLMLTPLRDLDVDLRFNSRSPTAGQTNSPYLLLPDTPADRLCMLAAVAGSKASPSSLVGTTHHACAARSSPGGMNTRPEMSAFTAVSSSRDAVCVPPPPLHEALEMTGGVDGRAHRKLLDMLNHANISKLCSLKGIGKQRARKLVETRQLHPYGPVFSHLDQLASVAGMTSRQIDKFFVDNLETPLPR